MKLTQRTKSYVKQGKVYAFSDGESTQVGVVIKNPSKSHPAIECSALGQKFFTIADFSGRIEFEQIEEHEAVVRTDAGYYDFMINQVLLEEQAAKG